MYHYSSPPPGWSAYDYTTTSPPTSPHYTYYAPQYPSPHASPFRDPGKRHSRKASYATTKDPVGGWHSPVGYPSPHFYETSYDYASPPRKHEYVSATSGGNSTSPTSRDRRSKGWDERRQRRDTMQDSPYNISNPFNDRADGGPSDWQTRYIFTDVVDDAYQQPPPSSHRRQRSDHRPQIPKYHCECQSRYIHMPRASTDHSFYYNQVPYEEPDTPKRSRARRASTSTRTPNKPKPSHNPKTPPKATEEDAINAGIPPGYSIKNWDPTEAPIVLLGSVFDANSLGKWIYDWTVFHHGASTPMAEIAGDMWLLLIKLAGKVKRADECAPRIRSPESREMVDDFLESGDRLWMRFKKLLKACEHFMWKAAKREGGKGPMSMGRNAGCEFVESIFGRDRELENTEKLMHSIRLWNMRFDANCEHILRRPSVA